MSSCLPCSVSNKREMPFSVVLSYEKKLQIFFKQGRGGQADAHGISSPMPISCCRLSWASPEKSGVYAWKANVSAIATARFEWSLDSAGRAFHFPQPQENRPRQNVRRRRQNCRCGARPRRLPVPSDRGESEPAAVVDAELRAVTFTQAAPKRDSSTDSGERGSYCAKFSSHETLRKLAKRRKHWYITCACTPVQAVIKAEESNLFHSNLTTCLLLFAAVALFLLLQSPVFSSGHLATSGVISTVDTTEPWEGDQRISRLDVVFLPEGTDNLQITVTPIPESFPHGKLLPISPTWPFSEVPSSSAVDRIKNVLGPSPDNTSVLQVTRTPPPRTPRRARAHGDFSSSPYQGSGHSASLEPSKDSTESLVQPRPRGGGEAAATPGLPHASMLPPLSTVPSGTALSAVSPSQPVWVGTPSISQQCSPRSDTFTLLPPSSSSSLAPDSPHSIIFSKLATRPTKVPSFPQIVPTDSSPTQSVANPLNPFADEVNHTPSRNAQDLIDIPHLGFSESSTKQYSELFPMEGPSSAGPSPLSV
ncbi:hypothetical protein HPG69_007338 [Diceros bicornis minor]|uniref:Uncharacterized protein n=1 Tax=Diceros bicornis minor TaxID=77932 RepID=A0A7J7EKP3_DICBM|nr:hypothetical protein HPG69_007338 [Diceros bicornis minor]